MANKPYYMTGTTSGYAEYLKQYKNTDDGISYWESLLAAPTAQYEASVEQATKARDYDISGAYANWKQNQLKLLQSSNLGTGVKSEISSTLESQYKNTYAQAQQEYLTNVYSAYKDYLKSVNTAEEQVNTYAQLLSDVTPMALQYYAEQNEGVFGNDAFDYNKAFVPKDKGGYGIYDYDPETMSYSLSDYGKSIYDEVFGGKVSTLDPKTGEWSYNFKDWLGNLGGYEDFIKLYESNPKLVAGAIGGERASDLYYSSEEKASDYVKNVLSTKSYKIYDDFKDDVEKAEYYKNYDANQLNLNKVNMLRVPNEIKTEVSKKAKELGIHEMDGDYFIKGYLQQSSKGRSKTDETKQREKQLNDLYEYMYHEYYKKTGKYLTPDIFYNGSRTVNQHFAR